MNNLIYIFVLIGYIGSIIFYVALFMFYLIPPVVYIPLEKEKEFAKKISPEQSLKLLKNKLDLGLITNEEYQIQRAEIIKKL